MDKLYKDTKIGFMISKEYYVSSIMNLKMILIALIEVAFIITVYKNIGIWLRYTGNTVGIFELLPYSFMQDIPFLVVIIGIIISVGDLPCVSKRTRFEIIRINKRAYLLGQMFYIVEISITYFVYIWGVILLAGFPKYSVANEWSYFIETATKGTEFLDNNIELFFSVELMKSFTPIEAFGLALGLGILFAIFTGNVIMLCNLRLRYMNISTVICMAFIVLDVVYSKINIGAFRYIFYISPISMMKAYAYSSESSTIIYSAVFLFVGSIIMFMWSMQIVNSKGIELDI